MLIKMPNVGQFSPYTVSGATLGALLTPVDGVSAGIAAPALELNYMFTFADAATTTYTFTSTEKIEILDVFVIKRNGAGAGNTVQVKDGSANAVSDAMACAVDATITRAATITNTGGRNVIAAGGTFQITVTRAAGTANCRLAMKVVILP